MLLFSIYLLLWYTKRIYTQYYITIKSIKLKKNSFIYEHEVLKTLRRFGLTITQTGNDTDGYEPFDKFQLGTAFLHYGTLVDLMFNPLKYKGQLIGIHNVKTKRHEVKIKNEQWISAAKAIEVLEMNGDIEDRTDSKFTDITTRQIYLTEKGLMSFNTDRYIKEYKRDRYQNQLYNTQINTNFLMCLFNGLLVVTAIVTIMIQSCQDKNKNPIESHIIKLQTTLDSIRIYHKDVSLALKEIVVSLKKKKVISK